MNKLFMRPLTMGLFAAFVSLPLYAQTAKSDETIAKVETNGGVIMISQDGEFQTALPDQRVASKARLMVSEGSSATVVYDDGCDQKYEKPGVYEISETCVLPVLLAPAAAVKGWVVAGSVIGGGLIAVLIADNHKSDSRPPVSR